MQFKQPYRMATPSDAKALAELINIASEGLAYYLWSQLAGAGQSPWLVGQERACRDSGSFSYRNTVVRDQGGVVACLIGYAIAADPEPTDYSDMPAMFVPLQQLEDMVPGTWYVNALATYPEYRGRGYGQALLVMAEALAVEQGLAGMSIIVSDANAGARRLYQRQGYIELAQRPMVKDGWQHEGANWLLLTKALG